MSPQFQIQVYFGTAALELCGLFVLVFALWWMRQSIRRRRDGSGGLAPAVVAGALAAVTAIGMVGVALFAAFVMPMAIEVLEAQAAGTEQQQAMLDQPAPPLEFSAVADDRAYSLDEFTGEVVLVNFWATWCPPCVDEMPDLERLQSDLGPRGLRVIHLSEESRRKLNEYVDENRPTNLHAYADGTQWPDFALPTSYVVDRAGVVRAFHVGGQDYEFFAGWVEPYL